VTERAAASSGFQSQSMAVKPLKTGLLRHLAKLAELSDEDFE
jgi:hypothetical protein